MLLLFDRPTLSDKISEISEAFQNFRKSRDIFPDFRKIRKIFDHCTNFGPIPNIIYDTDASEIFGSFQKFRKLPKVVIGRGLTPVKISRKFGTLPKFSESTESFRKIPEKVWSVFSICKQTKPT